MADLPLDFPMKGLFTSAADEKPPSGTSPEMRNMRPRDWKHEGKARGATRPGSSRFTPELLATGSRARAMVMALPDNLTVVEDEEVYFDLFDRADTSGPEMGSTDYETGGNDNIFKGSTNSLDERADVAVDTVSQSVIIDTGVFSDKNRHFGFAADFDKVNERVLIGTSPEYNNTSPTPNDIDFPQIFVRENNGWIFFDALKTSGDTGPTVATEHGSAVAIDDVWAMLGAPNGTTEGSLPDVPGYVRAFKLNGPETAYDAAQTVLPTAVVDGMRFGHSIALVGTDLIIGAPEEDGGKGAVYYFALESGTWVQKQRIQPAAVAANDKFGTSVSLGSGHLLIGAHLDDGAGTDRGIVYAFVKSGSTFGAASGTPTLVPTTPEDSSEFGKVVSTDGVKVAISAHLEDNTGTNRGSVYVFSVSGETWTEDQELVGGADNDRFGTSVALDGAEIAVGVPTTGAGDNFEVFEFGATYVKLASGPYTGQGDADEGDFGNAVAIVEDKFVGCGDPNRVGTSDEAGAFTLFDRVEDAATGDGPHIDSNTVVDEKAYSSGDYILYGVYLDATFQATFTDPYPILTMTLRMKTAADIDNTQGAVGFITHGDSPLIDGGAGTRDSASLYVISKALEEKGIIARGYVNGQGLMAGQAQVEEFEWKPATTYELRLTLNTLRAEVLINDGTGFKLLMRIGDVSKVAGIVRAAGDTDLGFLVASSGLTGGELFDWVDDWRVHKAKVVEKAPNPHVFSVNDTSIYVANSANKSLVGDGATIVEAEGELSLFRGPASTAGGGDFLYLQDGRRYITIDLRSFAAGSWTPTAGSLPQGSVNSELKARFGVLWRNRPCLYGLEEFPDNWFFGRSGDMNDWDTVPATRDGKEAIAGNTDREGPGLLPDRISALAPIDKDRMAASSLERLWMFVGDPADNGILEELTGTEGIVGSRAWTRDNLGNLFYAGLSGMFVFPEGGSKPFPLSASRIDGFFKNIDHSTMNVELQWHNAFKGIHIFVSPKTGTDFEGEHLWFDTSTGSFFPDTFPKSYGPFASASGVDPAGNYKDIVVFSGSDGAVRFMDAEALDDDGLAIDQFVRWNPIIAGSNSTAILERLRLKLGHPLDECILDIKRASSVGRLEAAPVRLSKKIRPRKSIHSVNQQISGGAISISMRQSEVGKRFSIEMFGGVTDVGDELPREDVAFDSSKAGNA